VSHKNISIFNEWVEGTLEQEQSKIIERDPAAKAERTINRKRTTSYFTLISHM